MNENKFNMSVTHSMEERIDKVIPTIIEDPPDAVRDRILTLATNVHDLEGEITDITIIRITRIVINIYTMTGGFDSDEEVAS